MELKGNIKDFPLPAIIQLVGLGKKTGMLSISFNNQKASLYFNDGDIVHASMLNTHGRDAVIKMFHLQDGKFHFFAAEKPEKETMKLHPMSVLMEAAKQYDEKREAAGVFDSKGTKRKLHEEKIEALKQDLVAIVKDLFGNKAKKLETLLLSCNNTEIDLIGACDKIEKYIYVFLDPENSKAIADKMRNLVEESH